MDFTPEHQEFRKTIEEFVHREINPHADRWEEEGGFQRTSSLRSLETSERSGSLVTLSMEVSVLISLTAS